MSHIDSSRPNWSLISNSLQKHVNSIFSNLTYISIARLVICIGIIYRFWIDKFITQNIAIILAIALIYSVVILIVSLSYGKISDRRFFIFQILVDTFIYAMFYFASRDPQTDFFLLFFLPLVLAGEVLSLKNITIYYFILNFIFVALIVVTGAISGFDVISLITRVYLPRTTFFLFVLFLTSARSIFLKYSRDELDELSRLDAEINRQFELGSVATLICQTCFDIFHAEEAHIRLFNNETQMVELVSSAGNFPRRVAYEPISLNDPNVQFVQDCFKGKVFLARDAKQDPYFNHLFSGKYNINEYDTVLHIKSFGCFPLQVGKKVFGILTVSFRRQGQLNELSQEKINEFINRYAIPLKNSQILDEERKRKTLLENERDIIFHISRASNLTERTQALAEKFCELFRISRCMVYLLPTHNRRIRVLRGIAGVPSEKLHVGLEISDSRGIVYEAIVTREIITTSDYKNSPYFFEDFDDGLEAVVAIPLCIGPNCFGVIVVSAFGQLYRHYNQYDLATFQDFGQIASTTLYSAKNLETQDLLQNAYIQLATHLDVKEIAQEILEQLRTFIFFNSATVQLISSDLLVIIECIGFTEPEKLIGVSFSLYDPSLPHFDAVTQQSIVCIEDIRKNNKFSTHLFSENITSWLGAPLFANGRVIGLITLDRKDDIYPYTDDDVLLIKQFTVYAALALNNAMRYQQAQILQSVTKEILKERSPKEVAKKIIEGLSDLIEFNQASVQQITGNERQIIAQYKLEGKIDSSIMLRSISEDKLVSKIIHEGKPYVISDTSKEPLWNSEYPATESVKSWIGLPLIFESKPQLFITLDHFKENYYQEADKALLMLFATQAAIAFANAQLMTRNSNYIETLEATFNRLEEANNLAMIGLIYGKDIHLSSNRLSAAEQLARNIEEYYDVSEEVIAIIKRIRENIREFIDLIYLMQQTVNAPEPVEFNIHESIDRVLGMSRRSKSISITQSYNLKSPMINGLERQVRQMLRVIIHNAISSMSTGEGSLTIETHPITFNAQSCVEVSITDTGGGIDPEVEPYLFEMGSRTQSDEDQSGFGIGLAWSRSVLRWYSGDLRHKSDPGKGTTFYLIIPCDFRKVSTDTQ